MTAKTRIYSLVTNGGDTVALIRAKSRPQALAHFASKNFSASLPTQDELFDAAANGLTIETANDEAEEAA
jgi:hypothetical protein